MVIVPSQGLKGALIRGRITAERKIWKGKAFCRSYTQFKNAHSGY